MIKYVAIAFSIIFSNNLYATQLIIAELSEINISGKLLEPFEIFNLKVLLAEKDNSIKLFELTIDKKPVKIKFDMKNKVKGVMLSTLAVTHSPIHAPDAEKNGITGVGPAYLQISYQFYSTVICAGKVGEVYISTKIDSLESTMDTYCMEEVDA